MTKVDVKNGDINSALKRFKLKVSLLNLKNINIMTNQELENVKQKKKWLKIHVKETEEDKSSF